ncbi:MAG: hypothetical protein Kow001_21390 [Acidobacteriota bacterium]
MRMTDGIAMELEHEAKSLRKTLSRIPEEKFAWKPHERSMSMGTLASHLAEIPGWVAPTLQENELEIPPDYKPWIAASTAELLDRLESNLKKALEALRGFPEEKLMETWTLRGGGTTIFALPRAVVLRAMVLSHLVHHRGQLTVYLRLNNIPVPAIYGPSADEQ